MVDFGSLRNKEKKSAPVAPRALYGLLPNKELGRGNLWDVQAQVLSDWHDRRADRDVVIKVNTGGGKTTVGLVLLQSYLNEGKGPALYVAPDKYLVKQVIKEANALGLKTTPDPDSADYLRSEAICVVNAYKLVNGRSVFSIHRPSRSAAPIGSVVIDDAHAAIATTRKQLSLELESDNEAFQKLLALFEEPLRHASTEAYLDVKDGRRGTPIQVPFWAWRERLDQARDILRTQTGDGQPLFFTWPAVKEALGLCRAVFANDRVTITAPCPPIEHISSFTNARHRVFLSATLADDSVLVTDFGAEPDSVRNPITPVTAGDIGERMILAPQEINPSIEASDIRAEIVKLSKRYNTVVLVPSDAWAKAWEDDAAEIAHADDIERVVDRLTGKKHVGLVVLINKYDGIDLPQDACRVLVIDGLPESFSPEERLQSLLRGNESGVDDRQVQRIEQGMGRGIRSNEDHCVVFLLGPKLSQLTVDPRTLPRFSAATRTQLALSREIADQMDNLPLSRIIDTAKQALTRESEWVEWAKEGLADLESQVSLFSESAVAERAAFDLALNANPQAAAEVLHIASETEANKRISGVLLEQEAAYIDAFDHVRAQQVLAVARSKNTYVTRPISGVTYQVLQSTEPQANLAATRLTTQFTSAASLRLTFESHLDALKFDPDHTEEFEEALYDIGRLIGLGSQRPEHEIGSGPDNLWALGNNQFWVIEAKSGANSKAIGKRDMGQLTQAMVWFGSRYDPGARPVPIMIHPSAKAYPDASAPVGMRVITERNLGELRAALRGFSESLATVGWTSAEEVGRLLDGHRLGAQELEAQFTQAQRGVL